MQEIRSILSTCTDSVMLLADPNGSVLHANALGLSELFGYEEDEVVNVMTLRQLLTWPEMVLSRYHDPAIAFLY